MLVSTIAMVPLRHHRGWSASGYRLSFDKRPVMMTIYLS
jgi:hypothetical protein